MSWLSAYWFAIPAGLIVLIGLGLGWQDLARFRFRRVRAIAGVCFTEAIRRRILWVTPVAIIGVVAVSFLTHPNDELDAIQQTTRHCLFASGLVVIVAAVLLACTNLPKEIENRVIFTIVTKPTTRLEIVLGKVLGFACVSAAMLLIMGVFTAGYLQLRAWHLEGNIRTALEAGTVDPLKERSLRYCVDAGLLNTKALSWPQSLEIYSRIPPVKGVRWMMGEESQFYIVPFALEPGQKTMLDDLARRPTALVFLVNELHVDVHPVQAPVEEDPVDPASLVLGPPSPTTHPAPAPATRPTTIPTTMPSPKVGIMMTSADNPHVGGNEFEGKLYGAAPRMPGEAQDVRTFLVPLSPRALAEIAAAPDITVQVLAPINGVEYGADENSTYLGIYQPMSSFPPPGGPIRVEPAPQAGEYRLYRPTRNNDQFLFDAVTVSKGAPLGFESVGPESITAVAGDQKFVLPIGPYVWLRTSEKIRPAERGKPGLLAPPHFLAHRARSGMQIRGALPGPKNSPMGVYRFENADVGEGENGKVTLQMHVFVERAGEVDERNALSQAGLQIRNRRNGEVSESLITFEPESSQSLYVTAPAKYFQGGDFDVIVRGLTPGQFLGLAGPSSTTPSVSVVTANTSFVFNLLKSLTILWLLSVLVVVISLLCSTFLSWPIAVVLTLMLLLGHWGIDQLGDAMAPGWSRTSAVDIFGFRGPTEHRAFTTTMEAMSKMLRMAGGILPDVGKFPVIEDIGRGVSIPSARLGEAAAEVVWYGLPALVLTYVILRSKEVAP